jgi:hypothetical protein
MAAIFALTLVNYTESIYDMTLPELLLTWYLLEEQGFVSAFNQEMSLHEATLLVEKSATAIESHSEKMFGNIDHEKGRIIAEILKIFHDEILSIQHLKSHVSAGDALG